MLTKEAKYAHDNSNLPIVSHRVASSTRQGGLTDFEVEIEGLSVFHIKVRGDLYNVDPPDKLRSLLGEGSELEHVLPCCRPGFASLYTKPGYY